MGYKVAVKLRHKLLTYIKTVTTKNVAIFMFRMYEGGFYGECLNAALEIPPELSGARDR